MEEQYTIVLGTSGDGGREAPMGRCVWEFTGESWVVKELQAEVGGMAGTPPSMPGRFKGQIRITPCVARA